MYSKNACEDIGRNEHVAESCHKTKDNTRSLGETRKDLPLDPWEQGWPYGPTP
jgi:hypothetical protein